MVASLAFFIGYLVIEDIIAIFYVATLLFLFIRMIVVRSLELFYLLLSGIIL
jgi:hypothetical protein